MNERMYELINQCFIGTTDGKLSELNTVANVEKFAELIVRESIVDFYRNYLDTTSDDDITEQVDRYVKQNFGVE